MLQEKDGSLGTKLPKEMELPSRSTKTLAGMHLSAVRNTSDLLPLEGDIRLVATVAPQAGSTFAIRMGSSNEEQVVFDTTAKTIAWIDSTGKLSEAHLDHVTDLSVRLPSCSH